MKNYQAMKVNKVKMEEWKASQGKMVIKTDDIILTESIHLNAEEVNLNGCINQLKNSKMLLNSIVVRELNNGKYSLVMGLKNLTIAKLLNHKEIVAVVTSMTHNELQSALSLQKSGGYKKPQGTEAVLPMKDIVIPKKFQKSPPRKDKAEAFKAYYYEHGCIDKPITVKTNKKSEKILIDGYARYVVYKEMNMKNIPVKFEKQR